MSTNETNNWSSKKWCLHNGMALTIDTGGFQVGGAAERSLKANYGSKTVLLNCTGRYSDGQSMQAPKGFDYLRQYTESNTVINLDWPDGGTPPVSPEFWFHLVEICKQNGYTKLVPYCIGSHGRTGTALACLCIMTFKCTAKAAVDYVRKVHCEEAVESSSQVEYILKVEEWAYNNGVIKAMGTHEISGGRSLWKTQSIGTGTYSTVGGAKDDAPQRSTALERLKHSDLCRCPECINAKISAETKLKTTE